MSDDFDNRRKIFDEVRQFNRTEQEELYRILRRCNEEISENRNGIFFDLNSLKQETIRIIESWIEFCTKNRSTLESREKEMYALLNDNFDSA
jgi:dsDNA-specific endonuclease/ATPase MutS2